MKHQFIPSQLKQAECKTCKRDYISHTCAATCDSCGTIASCDLFGPLLLCVNCTEKELAANTAIIMHTKAVDNLFPASPIVIPKPVTEGLPVRVLNTWESPSALVTRSREIDNSIRYNGDFFNAQTIAIEAIKSAIMSDESIPIDQRSFRAQDELAKRFEAMQAHVFKLNNEVHETSVAMLVVTTSLREFGNNLRESIRVKLKASDTSYQPAAPIKIPKVVKPKLSVFERLIESRAMELGVSFDEAKKMMFDSVASQLAKPIESK